jgi:hypothetical protein
LISRTYIDLLKDILKLVLYYMKKKKLQYCFAVYSSYVIYYFIYEKDIKKKKGKKDVMKQVANSQKR